MNLDAFKSKFAMLNNDSISLQQAEEDEELKRAKFLYENFKVVLKRDLKEAVISLKKVKPTDKQLDVEVENIITDVFKDKTALGLIIQLGTKEFINYLIISNDIK